MTDVPVLETERLLLRGHRRTDFDASAAMWGDPRVARHISGRPSTREESWGRLLRYSGHWRLMRFGYWAVEERASGVLVGEAGFGDFKRELSVPFDGAPEQGWAFTTAAHGSGYATEAGLAALAWAKVHFGAIDVVCLIAPENAASIRVAEKLGYRPDGRATYKDEESLLFRRTL